MDTSGFAEPDIILEVAKRTDLWLYDLKLMEDNKHLEWTGVSNQLILKNLQLLADNGSDINIRIPLIEGVNTDDENIHQSAQFIVQLSGDKKTINLLSYHNIAQVKYKKLGQAFDPGVMAQPSTERQKEIVEIFNSYNLEAIIGG